MARLGALLIVTAMTLFGIAAPASAAVGLDIHKVACHAVTLDSTPPPAAAFRCGTPPVGYQDRWLWLRVTQLEFSTASEMKLLLRPSRFDELDIRLGYADGVERRFGVRQGDYGHRWRIGGKLYFTVPDRDIPLTSVTLGFDHLAAAELIRARLLPFDVANRYIMAATALIGASLALLLLSIVYNSSLALGDRRVASAWHAAWAACVLVWALLWTQVILFFAPGLAGSFSARASAVAATAAISCACMSLVTALETGMCPRWIRRTLPVLACMLPLLSLAAVTISTRFLMTMSALLDIGIGLVSILVIISAGLALKRGSRAARNYILAWLVPLLAILLTLLTDRGFSAQDDSGQLIVLVFSALQMIGLTVTSGRTLAQVRSERDAARRSQAELQALAETDPLTGLLNRRGFARRVNDLLKNRPDGLACAFLLIDVDHFKTVNDSYGHQAGDKALARIAEMLRAALPPGSVVGRMGGEEFAMFLTGRRRGTTIGWAEQLRRTIAATDMALAGIDQPVTISLGLADDQLVSDLDLDSLYRAADVALYLAKARGRNCLQIAPARGDAAWGRAESRATTAPAEMQSKRRVEDSIAIDATESGLSLKSNFTDF